MAEETRTVRDIPHRPSHRGAICSIGFCELSEAGFVTFAAQLIVLREQGDIDACDGILDSLADTRLSLFLSPSRGALAEPFRGVANAQIE